MWGIEIRIAIKWWPDETYPSTFLCTSSIDTQHFETAIPMKHHTAEDSFLHMTCQTREGSGWQFVPEEHLLCFMCEGQTHDEHIHILYVRTHTLVYKACSNTRRTSVSHHQWHEPSVAVFRLCWALLMQWVPYNGVHFHFHPHTAAPPFCSCHLHRSLCTHNM